jgi:hypothetical protein
MKSLKILLVVLLVIFTGQAQQDVEEMMRKLEEATRKEMEETQKKVDQYISAQDSAFAAFLEKEWELYNTYTGKKNLEKPKPKEIPVAEPETKVDLPGKKIEPITIPEKEDKEEEEKEVEQEKQVIPPEPDIEKKKIEPKYKESLELNFYGAPVEIRYSPQFRTNLESPFDNKNISEMWKKLSATDYPDFLDALQSYKKKLNLNVWGYYKFINKVGREINQGSHNNSSIFTWFFLTKSGYRVRIAYNDNRIYLLVPSASMLYSISYLTINQEKYFLINREEGQRDKIYSYKNDYPTAHQSLDLWIKNEPRLDDNTKSKSLDFKYLGDRHQIQVNYKPALIEYLSDYPQTDYEIYFEAPLSEKSRVTLLKELAPMVEGKTTTEALNLLLRFVQTSFKYKTDDLNFGREKPLFPEETLFYPFSDCEDRSVLFAYLVRNLLDLKVIGIKYPGHIATAISIEGPLKGDYLSYQNEDYIICDPTYINANIGQSMPQFKNVKPEIIFSD